MNDTDNMIEALHVQSKACARLGSPLYSSLLSDLSQDYIDKGITYRLLHNTSNTPIHDAIPLRLLSALHLRALTAAAPQLVRHFPTTGGWAGTTMFADVLAVMHEHEADIRNELSLPVQTNEPGRAVCHSALEHWLPTVGVHHYRLIEVGASAGLTMSFDHYAYDFAHTTIGDSASVLHFSLQSPDNSFPYSDTRQKAQCTSRIGVDIAPIDITDPHSVTRLLSYVWPDQTERMARLRHAINITAQCGQHIEQASVDNWLPQQLEQCCDAPTVVFHSIVWQYLGPNVQKSMRATLEKQGNCREENTPLIWARMEPNGALADLQVTVWTKNSTSHYVLANVGYHGSPFQWLI